VVLGSVAVLDPDGVDDPGEVGDGGRGATDDGDVDGIGIRCQSEKESEGKEGKHERVNVAGAL